MFVFMLLKLGFRQLDKFYALCQDELWGVRKACAEVFMSLSRVISAGKRRTELGTIFVHLLQDESRWVRMAAFQALGPFISTFSRAPGHSADEADDEDRASSNSESAEDVTDPGFNSFYFWRDPLPELSFAPVTLNNATITSTTKTLEQSAAASSGSVSDSVEKALEDLMARVELTSTDPAPLPPPVSPGEAQSETVHAFDLRRVACQELLGSATPAATATSTVTVLELDTPSEADSIQEQNKAQVEEEEDQEDSLSSSSSESSNSNSSQTTTTSTLLTNVSPLLQELEQQQKQSSMILPPAYVKSSELSNTNCYSNSFYTYYPTRRRSDGSSDHSGRPRPYSPVNQQPSPGSGASSSSRPSGNQTVVPQNLMDYYLQMTDPYYVETVDAEITRHCAYSLPAVVCTLGKEHWPLLRDLYGTLASDMQWKVRRTLASSIHEIGAILGQQVVTEDLLPVFDGFIKDLDEVRIGVLKHLSEFLALLPEKERRSYLPRLADFLKLDNEQNWRFRQELAVQLQTVVGLFSSADSAQSILPLALTLASDRVAAVRHPAFTLVSRF